MRRIAMVFLVSLITLATAGCVISVNDDDGWSSKDDDGWQQRQRRNRDAIEQLELGRTQDSVTAELGAADLSEAFVRDGREYQVLFYRTHREHKDGRTNRDETTPLVFVDGLLVGWGESAVANAAP